jgi:glycosyltransferase involved in cell wall biosynthesis
MLSPRRAALLSLLCLCSCAVFPPLSTQLTDAPARRQRVLLVSQDVAGPVINGGIGTAIRNLAFKLSSSHSVTVLFTIAPMSMRGSPKTWEEWQAEFAERNVTLASIPSPFSYAYFSPGYFVSSHRSYEAFLWLREREAQFDVVHFPDWQAVGFWTLTAKRQGLCCAALTLVVQTHSPSIWALEGNDQLTDDAAFFDTDFLERRSVELADVLISPSQYMLNWMVEHGWRVPARTFYHFNAVYETNTQPPRTVQDACLSQVELVFFGRLERRKGLFLFLEALSRLVASGKTSNLHVTLMGTLVEETVHALDDALNRIGKVSTEAHANLTVDTQGHTSSEQATAFLLGRPCALAVMPSLLENLPYTILECVSLGIPFLASRVGGNAELIHPDYVEAATFAPTVSALHLKLVEALEKGLRQVRALAAQLARCRLTRRSQRAA